MPHGDHSDVHHLAARAERSAAHAERAARRALAALLPEEAAEVASDRAPQVAGGRRPERPLVGVMEALAPAAHSAATACHLAGSMPGGPRVVAATRAAEAVVSAVLEGIEALADDGGPGSAAAVERLAHGAALAAHLCADSLSGQGHAARATWFGGGPRNPSAYPGSWRALLDALTREVQASRGPRDRPTPHDGTAAELLEAAAAARHGAANALDAYSRCEAGDALGTALARCARLLALAATQAGLAAMDALAAAEAGATAEEDAATRAS